MSKKFKLALITLHGDELWGKSLHYYNPLSITTLGGYVKYHLGDEIEIALFDTLIHSYDEIIEKVFIFNSDLTGISVKTDSLMELRKIIPEIKNSKLVLGGITPTIIYKKLLQEFPFAYIIRGEGEEPLLNLVRYFQGKIELRDVPSLAFIKENKIIETEAIPFSLNELTFQPTDDFTENCIKSNGDFWLESSRGCRKNCSFCSKNIVHNGNYGHRRFHIERSVKRIKDINSKFGIKTFRFADEDFLNDDFEFIHNFCHAIKSSGIKFEIDASIRGIYNEKESEDKKLKRKIIWEEMKNAGLSHIFIGIESLSDSQLKRYRKGITVKDITSALSHLNVPYTSGFISFDPFVTVEELTENLVNLRDTGIIRNINTPIKVMRVQYGTDMAEMVKEAGIITGETENGMCYTYRFRESHVEKIYQIIMARTKTFKVYGPRLSYIIRPTASYIKEMDNSLINYLTEKVYELKIMELNFLIDLTKNYNNEEKINKIETNFMGKYKSLYMEIGRESEKVKNKQLKEKLKEICSDFLREVNL